MKCYLCDVELLDINLEDTNNHKEHIIPNAIGGRLKAQDLLCLTCGSSFGEVIDKNFVQIFFPFTERIDLARERGDNNNPIKGSMLINGKLKQVNFKNFKVFPAEPFHEIDEQNNTVYIYAHEKIATNFINKAKSDLTKSGKNISNLTFKVINDISGVVDFDFKMENESFALGLNKIATEFAILHKINKHQLTRSLDLKERAIIETKNIFPYFPLGKFEKAIELVKPYIDSNFPAHHLILFTEKINNSDIKLLVCYIELFSTFQYYVILNENYNGADEMNLEHYDIKDLMIICQENGIPIEGTIDELKISVSKKISVGKSYSKDLSQILSKTINNFITPLVFSFHKENLLSNITPSPYFEDERVKKTMHILTEMDDQDLLDIIKEMRHIFLNDDDSVNIQPYRKYFLGSKNIDIFFSYIFELPNFLSENMDQLKQYKRLKFYMLNDFASLNQQQRKDSKPQN
jgi:hypothetical protein